MRESHAFCVKIYRRREQSPPAHRFSAENAPGIGVAKVCSEIALTPKFNCLQCANR
jgi:hypothetical protein